MRAPVPNPSPNPREIPREIPRMPSKGVQKIRPFLRNEQGELRMIAKGSLHVDESYQRDEIESKVLVLEKTWSHVACGAITVALRHDETFYVIDGHHRVLAALRLANILELPCIVFHFLSIEDEAKAFIAINTNRRPMEMLARFRALKTAKDEVAVHIAGIIDGAGYRVSKATTGRSVKCVGALMGAYKHKPEVFERIWPLIVDVAAGGPIHERVVKSLFHIECRLRHQDLTLTRQPWRDRVIRLGTEGILDGCAKAAAMYAYGGARIWARGVIERLNHKARIRLNLPTSNEPNEDE